MSGPLRAWQIALAIDRRRWPGSTDDPLGPVDQDPDAARDAACDLTQPNAVCFPSQPDPVDPPPPPDVTATTAGGGAGGGLGTLLVVLLVAALVVFLVWLVVTIVRRRGSTAPDEDDEELDEELGEPVERRRVDHERPPDRWRRAAAEHRDAGRYRDAVRCEYRALVGDLARAGLVDEIPGRTSGEERAQLADLAPSVADEFDTAADLFDEAWFGDRDVTAADDGEFVAASRSVLGTVLTGSGGGREGGRP